MLRPVLDLEMNQDELRRPLVPMDTSHHIGLPHIAFRKIREELLVQELKRRAIEPCRHVGVEKLQEVFLWAAAHLYSVLAGRWLGISQP